MALEGRTGKDSTFVHSSSRRARTQEIHDRFHFSSSVHYRSGFMCPGLLALVAPNHACSVLVSAIHLRSQHHGTRTLVLAGPCRGGPYILRLVFKVTPFLGNFADYRGGCCAGRVPTGMVSLRRRRRCRRRCSRCISIKACAVAHVAAV